MCVVGRLQRNLCSILEENVHCESHHEENSQKNTAFGALYETAGGSL